MGDIKRAQLREKEINKLDIQLDTGYPITNEIKFVNVLFVCEPVRENPAKVFYF